MDPKTVGALKTHEPVKSKKEVPDNSSIENYDSLEDIDNTHRSVDQKKADTKIEDGMLEQDFLLDPSMTVGQVSTDYGIDILDFVRYECGEN